MSGLMDMILGSLPIRPSSKPEIKDNKISIKFTEAEFKQLLENLAKDDNSKRIIGMIDIKMNNGYMELILNL